MTAIMTQHRTLEHRGVSPALTAMANAIRVGEHITGRMG